MFFKDLNIMKYLFSKITIAVIFIISVISCSEEHYVRPVDKDAAPGQITDIQAIPLNGGAKITYKLPKDENIRYVKAVYEIRPGVEREAIASIYTNSLIVDGFFEEKEYEVKLYTVTYGENIASQPAIIKFTPLISPLKEAYNSFAFEETFGGVTMRFDNNAAASLAVTLLVDSTGTMEEVETYYTKSIRGVHSTRGFKDEPLLFGAIIRDRWGNLSDTITQIVTPLFEEFIPKGPFRALHLPTDTYEPHITNGHLEQLWDGRWSPTGGIGVFHTKPGSGMPQWFTFDMGQTVMLSRFKLWHRGGIGNDVWAYQLGSPRRWEVWGMAEAPDPTGTWDGWTKLMDCESYKPSGDGPITNEDLFYATDAGEDFIFPTEDISPVRYLRFRMLETWGYLDYIYISELSFWGRVLQ